VAIGARAYLRGLLVRLTQLTERAVDFSSQVRSVRLWSKVAARVQQYSRGGDGRELHAFHTNIGTYYQVHRP
jgi:hypothetical protein